MIPMQERINQLKQREIKKHKIYQLHMRLDETDNEILQSLVKELTSKRHNKTTITDVIRESIRHLYSTIIKN